ncbi:YkyA family protein [Alkalicoccobacillus porphyridii]|uniref:Cell-wall binding lipoprotein n=1 Tax=Alkalicoccobacillus porphyridii TaxID=2597270 RepID=A0A553ZUZ2_9BACI|nr:YkyA family protein [Alkalicoccobacillus porphyridii]TSB45308.1 hypothetical protein FN960_16535 [Alkalicoccobacillus porphyridii]
MKRPIQVMSVISLGMLLTACSTNPEETIYNHFEAAVEEESVFAEQQSQLQQAEEQEQEWYEEIILLGMDEYDTIVSLTEQAQESIEHRRELLEEERAGIEAGYEEASQAQDEFDSLEDQETRDLAEQVQEAMETRYESYDSIYSHYSESLDLDFELFQLLAQEDLNIDELEEQIEKVNEKYSQITEATEEFNNQTDTYNELKKSFYEAAGLDIEYNE